LEDVKYAQAAGLKTVFVTSQFFSFEDLGESGQKPDFVEQSLDEVFRDFSKIIIGVRPRKSFNCWKT